MEVSPVEFYLRIINCAKTKDIPIRQLEIKAGVPIGTIKRWKIKIPAGDSIAKVADQLDVSIDFLFGRTDEPLSHKTSKFSEEDRIISTLRQNRLPPNVVDAIVSLVNQLGVESRRV